MPAQAILGDAATARPSLIFFNPTVRARNRGRRTGRGLDRSPQRAWVTPLDVLLVAERADVLCHSGSRPLSPPPPPQDLSRTQ